MLEPLFYNIWHPKLRRLYQYWDETRGERRLPARADIDPIEIPDLLPNILLVNVHHAPLGFTDRLVGTAVVDILGLDTTGQDPSRALPQAFRDVVPRLWRECVARREPARADLEIELDERLRRYECLVLPLSEDGVVINMLLAGVCPRTESSDARRIRAYGGRPRLRLVVGGEAAPGT